MTPYKERQHGEGQHPVLYQRGRHIRRSVPDRDKAEVFTVFVDNLPSSMNSKGLSFLFNKFGVVKDVFIPDKTRKATRTRFGFVLYDCAVATEVAIQKADGIWCDDCAIKVNMAEFGKAQFRSQHVSIFKPKEGKDKSRVSSLGWEHKQQPYGGDRKRSFVEVIRAKNDVLWWFAQKKRVMAGYLEISL
ncbi:serine/arginine-rich splicing factor SC35-like [Camellia sinensis]|uniref:serine/arginine-rich splicing factor SC35-like n=1 Tax=Camellia sinensis TaxID=4442 RepID=UPI001035AC2D|nr:serine/arginine-rich splicing factor SC35-like [Camellia sinensis]